MANIETGVDRLVELVNAKKRITVEDAAKELGVSRIVIQEWADFLEEEKILSIEYKFSKTYLIERKLSKDEVVKKQKEYSSEKDAFVRKVETSLKTLESDALGLEKIKTQFKELKEGIGSELEKVKEEVKQLQKYEYLKQNLDKDIEKQVGQFHTVLDKAHTEVDAEQKRHQQILEALEIEKRELEVKAHRLKTLEDKEKELMDRIQNILDVSKDVEKRVGLEKEAIIGSEKRVSDMTLVVREIEKRVVEKKKSIQPMIDEAKKHEEQILKLQQEILDKVKQKTGSIKSKVEEGTKVVDNFEQFFAKKAEIENLINNTETERRELELAFDKLKQKAIAFNLSTKTSTVSTHIREMEKELNETNSKRSKFKEDLEKLIKLIKG
jgi:chromosome segregation ATPase